VEEEGERLSRRLEVEGLGACSQQEEEDGRGWRSAC